MASPHDYIPTFFVGFGRCIVRSGGLSPNSGNSISGVLILALLVAGFAFRKQLLWRVRNRLLLSYVLFGVVPIVLISLLISLTLRLGLGPLGADRVRRVLDARIREVQAAAQDIDGMPPATRSYLLERVLARIPRLGVVMESDGKTLVNPPNGPFREAPAWVEPRFQGLIQVGESLYIAAKTNSVFAFLPLTFCCTMSGSPKSDDGWRELECDCF